MRLSIKELVTRTVRESLKDRIAGLAAELAYYLCLAVGPASLALVSLIRLFPSPHMADAIAARLGPFAPTAITDLIRGQLSDSSTAEHASLLSLGFAFAIWSSSSATVAMMDIVNRAFGIAESRPWWKLRLLAIALTLGLAVIILIALGFVLVGPQLVEHLASFGTPSFVIWTLKILQWPVVVVVIAVAIGLLYYFGSDATHDWRWITPGAVLASALWMLASVAFRIYVVNFGKYDETYGAIGGGIVVLLWLYLSSFALIIGAELDAEIEHASPWGPGERPRENLRRHPTIGPAAVKQGPKQPGTDLEQAPAYSSVDRSRPSVPSAGKSAHSVAHVLQKTRDMAENTYGSFSESTRDAAGDLADRASDTMNRASEMATRAQSKVVDYFREHDMQDMVDDVTSYVKSHPVQSLVAAASLGFLAAAVLRRR
jgi:membrane protein